jgi:hypothetical protein
MIFAAPPVEAEPRRAAALVPATMIAPVSRSQMSPNGWTTTSASGARSRATAAAVSSLATRTTRSPAPSA